MPVWANKPADDWGPINAHTGVKFWYSQPNLRSKQNKPEKVQN